MTTPCDDNTDGGGAGFLLGTLLTGGVAVLHNVSKDDQHRREIAALVEKCNTNYRAWQYSNLELQNKNSEIQRLQAQVASLQTQDGAKDQKIRDLDKELAAYKVKATNPYFPDNGQN